MRRALHYAVNFTCILGILLFFASCTKEYISDKEKILYDYKQHKTSFELCSKKILDCYVPLYQDSFIIMPSSDGIAIKSLKTAHEEWSYLSNSDYDALQMLFQATNVQKIVVNNKAIQYIEYYTGVGSTTYAGICFIQDGSIESLPEYNCEMQFDDYDGGIIGKLTKHDNYLFYQIVAPSYYFFEYGD